MKAKLLFFALFLAASSLIAGPKLEIIGGNTYDWGDVKASNEGLTTTVKLKNVGDGVLEISNVKPSCGCTTAPIDKDKLQPGETASIDVTFKPGTSSGPKTKTIRISSNDSQSPNVIYRLKANVVKNIDVGPKSFFNFSEVAVGNSVDSKLTVTNHSKRPVTFSDYKVEGDQNVTINLTKPITLKPNESFDVVSTITPDKVGYSNFKVTMTTSDPDTPQLVISGYARAQKNPLLNSGSN
ncbi:MAG: DUF1573 domain-containing protein [Candidatus Kapaibacteriales bacterium]